MKDLILKIRKVRSEVDKLQREKGVIERKLKQKKERLESLEILTVNQLDIFDGA